MKGNLSKKKGLLGDITTENLDYIASKLNTEYGARLGAAESEIDRIDELLSITNDLVKANAGVLDLHEDYLASAEYKENKVHSISTQSPSKEKYPSEYAVSEAINKMNADVDLSNYFTKEETYGMLDELNDRISLDYVSVRALANALSNYYTRSEVGLELGAMRDNFKETFIDLPWLSGVLSDYYTKGIVDDKIINIENLIGGINTAIENIIAKYELGGDAS